ncbi:hypothetical protein [Mycobacterium sp. D16R24]|uniref:hypothetical protein n=1 Tax=Mycobacterium sp. D16R24 TaxID=1855656 RepID=UPI00257014A9|nr:hypothetical protein [Mycobacterium sp. D16R24]
MTGAFLVAHGLRAKPGRKGAELQAAEDYWQWVQVDGRAELEAIHGAAVDNFVRMWRLRAVASDVRALSAWTELRLLMAFGCLVVALLSAVAHSFPTVGLVSAIFVGLVVSLHWRRRSILIVGPDAPPQLPPLLAGDTPLRGRGQDLVFRLATGRDI